MKKVLAIIILFLSFSTYAQENADSLKQMLCCSHDTAKAAIYNELACIYINSDINIAEKYADTAIAYARPYGAYKQIAVAYREIGLVNYKRGNFQNAIENYESAERIAKRLNNPDIMYMVHNDMGIIYQEYGIANVAKKYYDLAIENAKIISNPEAVVAPMVNKANLFYYDEMYDSILLYYDSALNISTDINTKIALYNNIAYLQHHIGQNEKSQRTYETLIELLQQGDDVYTYAQVLNNMISADIENEKFDDAMSRLVIADSICRKNSFNDIQISLYQNYHDYYMRLGDYENSNFYLEKMIELEDSVYSYELNEKLNALENKYVQEKADIEVKHRDEKIQHQQTVNCILAAIIVLAILSIVAILLLFAQKNKLNKLLSFANENLSRRDSEISSNLEYAREIQLGCMNNASSRSSNMFVLDLPKTTVGGDFNLVVDKGEAKYIVVGDCTGHGISGGFLSVLGIKSVYSAIEKYDSLAEIASEINNDFYQIVSSADNLKGESLCLSIVRICGNELKFLGSKHKIWIVSDRNIVEHKTANEILGSQNDMTFNEMSITLNAGDAVFLSSDGYPDQFGSDGRGKLKYARFREILLECATMDPEDAKKYLMQKLESWKGSEEQTDDILVVGLYK